MKKRSVGLMILFTIITGGIYILYWNVSTQNRFHKALGMGFGGVGHFFMNFVPFYSLYWQYACGKRIIAAGGNGHPVLYLVFCFIGLAWLNPYLQQGAINDVIRASGAEG